MKYSSRGPGSLRLPVRPPGSRVAPGTLGGVSLAYRIMYGVGFTPWDTNRVPTELSKLDEGLGALPAGQDEIVGPLRKIPRTWYPLVRA